MAWTIPPRLAVAAFAGSLLFAQPAHAALGMMAMPMAVTSALAAADSCPAAAVPELGASSPFAAMQTQSKASALLGGQVSQLELMRQQQAGVTAPASVAVSFGSAAIPEPGAGAAFVSANRSASCATGLGWAARTALPQPRFGAASLLPTVPSPDTILASKRLAIRNTPFDREWNRVRGSGLARSAASAAFGHQRGKADFAALSAANSWANSQIRYVEDRALYGQADRWATASETLRRRAGDCEDIAIVKMQLLASRGVAREDIMRYWWCGSKGSPGCSTTPPMRFSMPR
jgi:predicted transglutaminase-like cysteine proteinase